MHFSRRGIIVTLCFAVWIGAAGVICRVFVSRPLEGEQIKPISPTQVVHVEAGIMPARVALAQR